MTMKLGNLVSWYNICLYL